MTLEAERLRRAQLDSFGGYDWGDPVRLLTVKAPVEFTEAQLAIAGDVFDRRWAA